MTENISTIDVIRDDSCQRIISIASLGWVLIGLSPILIAVGEVFPAKVKATPYLLYFIDSLLIVLSFFILGVGFLLPTLFKLCNKIPLWHQLNPNEISLIYIRNIFIYIVVWSLMILPAFHLYLDIHHYTIVMEKTKHKSEEEIEKIDRSNQKQELKTQFLRTITVVYRKNIGLYIPDDFLTLESWNKLPLKCKTNTLSEVCPDLKSHARFSLNKISEFKHLTFWWKPAISVDFVIPENDLAKRILNKPIENNDKIKNALNIGYKTP